MSLRAHDCKLHFFFFDVIQSWIQLIFGYHVYSGGISKLACEYNGYYWPRHIIKQSLSCSWTWRGSWLQQEINQRDFSGGLGDSSSPQNPFRKFPELPWHVGASTGPCPHLLPGLRPGWLRCETTAGRFISWEELVSEEDGAELTNRQAGFTTKCKARPKKKLRTGPGPGKVRTRRERKWCFTGFKVLESLQIKSSEKIEQMKSGLYGKKKQQLNAISCIWRL